MKIDDILRTYTQPAGQPVDLTTAVQAHITLMQCLRLGRRLILATLIVTGLLSLLVWVVDGHCLELILYPWFHTLQGHWSLYWAAVWASIPKVGLITALLLSVLLLVSHRIETFLMTVRTTSINKDKKMRLIRQTPRLALIAGAIAVTVTGVAGFTYAKAAGQKKLEVLRQQTDAKGHQTVTTNFDFNDCNVAKTPNLTSKYEVKSGLDLSTEDVARIIEAKCNADMTQALIQSAYAAGQAGPTVAGGPSEHYVPELAARVKAYTTNNITLEAVLNGQLTTSDLREFSGPVTVYRNGVKDKLSNLKVGEIVIPVSHLAGTLTPERDGLAVTQKQRTIVGLIVMPARPELKWYDPILAGGVTRISTCIGNEPDECVGLGSMDLYTAEFKVKSNTYKQIQGRITALHGAAVTLQSSSGRSFTVTFPRDVVKSFNAQHGSNKINIGDSLDINYYEAPAEHKLSIAPDQIQMASLRLDVLRKQDPPRNY